MNKCVPQWEVRGQPVIPWVLSIFEAESLTGPGLACLHLLRTAITGVSQWSHGSGGDPSSPTADMLLMRPTPGPALLIPLVKKTYVLA